MLKREKPLNFLSSVTWWPEPLIQPKRQEEKTLITTAAIANARLIYIFFILNCDAGLKNRVTSKIKKSPQKMRTLLKIYVELLQKCLLIKGRHIAGLYF